MTEQGLQQLIPAWQEAVKRWQERGYKIEAQFGDREVIGISIENNSVCICTSRKGVINMYKPVEISECIPTRDPNAVQQMIEVVDDWLKIAESPRMTENTLSLMKAIDEIRKAPLRSRLVYDDHDIDQFVGAVGYLLEREETA